MKDRKEGYRSFSGIKLPEGHNENFLFGQTTKWDEKQIPPIDLRHEENMTCAKVKLWDLSSQSLTVITHIYGTLKMPY